MRRKPSLTATAIGIVIGLALLMVVGVAGMNFYRSMFVLTRMPDLAGLDSTTALKMVDSAGLWARLDYAYSDMPEGYVAAQSPAAQTEVERDTSVLVVISKGSGQAAVQKYSGMTQENAEAAILAQGLTLGEVTVVPSTLQRGTVVSQEPEVGTNIPLGSSVSLSVSGGRVVVPELVGHREEEALERISTVGLACGMIEYETVESASRDGVVLTQSLEQFSEVLPGTVVEMTVGYYDKRKYSAQVAVNVTVPEEGVNVRVTLVGEDGKESDMYAAMLTEPGEERIQVLLRSEQSGVMTWRTYLDGGFAGEATAVLK